MTNGTGMLNDRVHLHPYGSKKCQHLGVLPTGDEPSVYPLYQRALQPLLSHRGLPDLDIIPCSTRKADIP